MINGLGILFYRSEALVAFCDTFSANIVENNKKSREMEFSEANSII